jgi:hypothetical protein
MVIFPIFLESAVSTNASTRGELIVACKRCSSENRKKFNAEMNLHFPGREGLDKPTVWLFPEVVVCLHCGLAEFSVPEAEVVKLAEEDA